jgi:hypothetical protein
MINNPVTRHTKNETIRKISILESSGLSTKVTTMKTSSGPQAHHSPHIAAGEATLQTEVF